MQIAQLDLVTLPDGTTWLRLKDRMVRWTTSAEYLSQLGLSDASPAADGADALELAQDRMRKAQLALAEVKHRESRLPAITTSKPSVVSAGALDTGEETPRRRGGRASDPAKVAEARQLFELTNTKLSAIAEQVGMKLPTLHGIATREGWKRRALVKGPK